MNSLITRSDFCDGLAYISEMKIINLPDGRYEKIIAEFEKIGKILGTFKN